MPRYGYELFLKIQRMIIDSLNPRIECPRFKGILNNERATKRLLRLESFS